LAILVALAKMQTDLSDGVRYLVQQGIADPARVGIAGASYGGYAALKHEDQP
jgi:dipeptidyl aminopeptidase/acylaminoacyl peptidase